MTRKHTNLDDFSASTSSWREGERITSAANASIKLLRSLDRKKARADSGLFVTEGERLVREALDNGWTPRILLVGDEALMRGHTVETIDRAHKAGARILLTSARLLGAVSKKDNPQTLIAAFQQRDLTLGSFATNGPRRWIALYEVRDPGNLGTIVRTADAAGVDGVILVGQCCDPFAVETVRATMGSLFSTPLARATPKDFLDWRAAAGARLAAASINGDRRHDAADYGDKSVVLMGNEQAGLPPEMEAACDVLVRIPMRGAADSLNLAQATAVMTYEVWRDRGYDDGA
ncbi:MAG: RNA methyltransferase [Pseudomonadota bacterium]